MPRTFELVRHRDLSGVSGTGVVAEGCVFTDGSVALRWRGNNPATAVWPDLESVLAVHGHHGATEVHWLEGWTEPSPPPDPPELRGRPPLGERGARPLQDFYSASPETPTLPGADSNTIFGEHLDATPSETSPTVLDASHSVLDGPTILPRLAGLDYAAPVDREADSWSAPATDDRTALGGEPVLGDGAALGDGVLGDGAAFGEWTAAGEVGRDAQADADGREALGEGERTAVDAEEQAALDEWFGVQHAVLPPSGPVEPGGRVRGWAGARHRR
jgi:hypothetical protein